MVDNKTRLIFDTSAINKLAKDAGFEALFAGIKIAFFIRLTESSMAEVVSTTDRAERGRLVTVLRRSAAEGECILPFNNIVENAMRQYNQNPETFDWRQVPVRFPEAERYLSKHMAVSDTLAKIQRDQMRTWSDEFENIYTEMRPPFDAFFAETKETRPSLHGLVERFLKEGGALWKYGELLFNRVVSSPSEQQVRGFCDVFPPFHSLLISLCVVQYDRCIRDTRTGPSLRAGRLDMFMATYLPYCDVFVSDDERQLRCLQAVAVESELNVSVRSYCDFRAALIGIDR